MRRFARYAFLLRRRRTGGFHLRRLPFGRRQSHRGHAVGHEQGHQQDCSRSGRRGGRGDHPCARTLDSDRTRSGKPLRQKPPGTRPSADKHRRAAKNSTVPLSNVSARTTTISSRAAASDTRAGILPHDERQYRIAFMQFGIAFNIREPAQTPKCGTKKQPPDRFASPVPVPPSHQNTGSAAAYRPADRPVPCFSANILLYLRMP